VFSGKKGHEKLPKPQTVPALVQKRIVEQYKLPADLVPLLKAVVHRNADGNAGVDIRVFDEADAMARKIKVDDYNTLEEHPELILYDGHFDEASKKIEALSEPGSTVFFYQSRGVGHGGPLGMGAAVIELNPGFADKKGKKYIVYPADVVDMQPTGRGQKMFDTNKSRDIARWVKDSLQKRAY
jgi:hypothetical protein